MLKMAGVLVALSLAATGCGYRVMRTDSLFGAKRLAVLPFAESSSVGLSPLLADHLARLLEADGLALTLDRDAAQAVLDGRIDFSTVSSATRAGVQAYQITALVQMELKDPAGKRLWAGTSVVNEDFMQRVGRDVQPLLTEASRRLALRRLAERAANQVHDALATAAGNPPLLVAPPLTSPTPSGDSFPESDLPGDAGPADLEEDS